MGQIDWVSIAITLAIVGCVLLVHWKGQRSGQAASSSPRQVGRLFAEIRAIDAKLEGTATAADLELIRAEITRVEGASASAGMVVALEGKLNRMEERLKGQTHTLEAKIEAVAAQGNRTFETVDRIEGILVKQALEK